MSDLPGELPGRCCLRVEGCHALGLACRISFLSEPRGEPFAEKVAASSSANHLTRQRGALAQREANVRRSALIGVVCAPRASSAKRQRTHFFAR